ncbi:triggering receptor expressed on myeloid cells 2-like isoform X2 [Vombatus ursinus]|uniref:triggering receptor expressed on myeloid cells 2-like isoform X2 n=1 Tax=Vombatus ursinus TaxID=29139 RepID=UPI000FFCF39B|nr:triggering receptor expressed on myeloid cells 2-like isoform X2 [Vombatus ursinus]XP_027732438.1 triggering receptor expressed on myeloid cells 2-like isoform X2 [Vombatus ursinus]
MMAQAAPLLLLLPLLLIGSQGQVFPVKYQEGQTLRVNCSYNLQRDEKSWKSWCKVKEDGTVCNTLIIRKSGFPGLLWDTRASLADDTYTGRITITMSNLRVKDSGIYWCGIHDSVRNTIDILRTIRLEVSPATTSKITKHSQTTTETSLTTSAIFLATSSPRDNQKFIIWGSVLVSLLLVGLLSLGIIYIMKVSQKPGTGDDDCHHVYDDLEEQKQKTRVSRIRNCTSWPHKDESLLQPVLHWKSAKEETDHQRERHSCSDDERQGTGQVVERILGILEAGLDGLGIYPGIMDLELE